MHIAQVSADHPDVARIEKGLDAFNLQSGMPVFDVTPFAFIARDEAGAFLGGAKGKIFAKWLELSWLYAETRKQGTGTRLLQETERFAKTQGCHGIILNTLSFQAPGFYQKHGFKAFGEIPDFAGKESRLYLIKRF